MKYTSTDLTRVKDLISTTKKILKHLKKIYCGLVRGILELETNLNHSDFIDRQGLQGKEVFSSSIIVVGLVKAPYEVQCEPITVIKIQIFEFLRNTKFNMSKVVR